MPSAKPRVIYWFRTDLRLHDSPALKAALDLNPEVLYPIWTWDPHYVYRARVGPNRWQFLIDCQNDLSKRITAVNGKSKLFVLREAPQTLLPKLWKEWGISHLVFEKDTDAYGRERDEEVMRKAEEAGVEVLRVSGRTLWDSDDLVEKNGGKGSFTLSQLRSAGKKLGETAKPIPAPSSIPDPGDLSLNFTHEPPKQDPDINASHRKEEDKSYTNIAGPNGDFSVPTLEELGIPPSTTQHRGGESIALSMLDSIIKNEEYTATFEKPNTAPTAFSPQSTTLLSPHLHFGSLSCRDFYWRVQETVDSYTKKKKKASQPPTSLTGQLLFRDMYFCAQADLGHTFAQSHNNPKCRFIPFNLPSSINPSTGFKDQTYSINNPEAEEWFQRWKFGRTGFPWIDALMRQLRQEGWIHHLGRHAVACFLTRGGCFIHWERGAEVFEEWLLDHEEACNIGNWQWLSCTAFFDQYFRVYSPIAFPKKWDKRGEFVRRYVTELKDYDDKFVYEPWNAPVQDQKRWGCLVKGDGGEAEEKAEKGEFMVYPKPMFDFPERRTFCLGKMKEAYKLGLHGADEVVLSGEWKSLFADDVTDGKGGEVEQVENENGTPSKKDGHKRKASKGQTTLDGLVKRTKK